MSINIFTLLECSMTAELGEQTEVTYFPICKTCNRRPPPRFERVEFRFDLWAGEDMVEAMGCYAISKRFRQALEKGGIKGILFENMITSISEDFDIAPTAYAKELPEFYRLIISGQVTGPEIWWTSWQCQACGITHWSSTEAGLLAETAELVGTSSTERVVYLDSWQGDDLFRLPDPGPPLITERAVSVIEDLAVKDIVLRPAKWVVR